MKIAAFVLGCLLLTGCCHRETVVRTDTTTVYIPYTVRDTLQLHMVDSMWFAQDSVIMIRIDTLWKKVYYRITDTVRYTSVHTDTTQLIKEIIVEYTFWDKVRLVLLTLGCVLILGAVIRLLRR